MTLELILLALLLVVALQPVRRGAVCFFGIGESKSETELTAITEKSPNTASGRGAVAVRGRAPVASAENAVAAGGNNIFETVEAGGSQVKLGRGAKLTIHQNSDPELLKSVFNQQSAAFASVFDSTSKASSETLDALRELAEGKQTGGETFRDRTVLWIVLAAIAGAALIWGKRSVIYVVAAGAALWFIFGRGGKESASA